MKKAPYFRIMVTDYIAYTHHLTDAEVGKLFRALTQRAMGFPEPKLSEKLQIIFDELKNMQDEDFEKYEARIVISQKGGAARGRQQAQPKVSQPEPEPEPLVSSLRSDTEPKPFDSKSPRQQEKNPRAKKPKRPPKPKVVPEPLPAPPLPEPPEWLDAEVWADFQGMRCELQPPKPVTARSARAIFKQLENWRKNHDPNDILRTSIANGWAGVFEPKQFAGKGVIRASGAHQGQPDSAHRDTRDPAARAHDEAERIIAERRKRWAAEDAAMGRNPAEAQPGSPGAANQAPVPDLRQPADLRRQGADDGIPRRNVPDGAGGLQLSANPAGVS